MKRYKITMPTPEQCIASGLKFEGMNVRTHLWLMGVASGVSFVGGRDNGFSWEFNLIFAAKCWFTVETNSAEIIQQVEDYLRQYDCTVIELPA
jgi:hypothetical protein